MNHFELECKAIDVIPKTSRNEKKFYVIRIGTTGGETIPLSIWGRPPGIGEEIHVEGKLIGYGDYPNPKVTSVEPLQPVDGSRRSRIPETEHFEIDDDLPF